MLARSRITDARLVLRPPPTIKPFRTTSFETLSATFSTHYAAEMLRQKAELIRGMVLSIGTRRTDSTRLHAVQAVHGSSHVHEVWENQRYVPLVGWKDPSLGIDRPKWSDVDGKPSPAPSAVSLGQGWSWDAEWEVDYARCVVDKDGGWLYATNFPHAWHPVKGMTDFVRRRKWLRKAIFKG